MREISQSIESEALILEDIGETNTKVLKLQEELDMVRKEMQQFAYIVSHDLQAPLRMVTGFLELLERKHGDKLDAGARQYIEYAVKGSIKMKSLIFDLLELSRLNTVVTAQEPVNITELLSAIAEKHRTAPDIIIYIEKMPAIYGDMRQLEILFNHFFSNAVKFRSDKPLEVNVSGSMEGDLLKVSVADNGIGIDPAFFEKIFVIFRRLHTDEIRYPGTGVGLAMCKKIAELHGGSVGVDSAPGKGSTFWVTLPIYT